MATLNNVNVGMLEKATKEAAIDGSKARRTQKLNGEWLPEEGGPQFRAELSFEGGKLVMESDQPTGMGGGGSRPGPMHYCFFGLISCYTATFAAMASMMGIELKD